MGRPLHSKQETLSDHTHEREEKMRQYTRPQGPFNKMTAMWSKEMGNVADWAIQAGGNKYGAAAIGTGWGLLKGAVLGIAFAVPAALLLQVGAPVFLGTLLYNTIRETRNLYFAAEAHDRGRFGKKVGDQIAASGNARSPVIKEKILARAHEKLHDEMPQKTAAEYQFPNAYIAAKDDQHFQNKIIEERRLESAQAVSAAPVPVR